jgi:hypothetical protein
MTGQVITGDVVGGDVVDREGKDATESTDDESGSQDGESA